VLLQAVVDQAERTPIADAEYLRLFAAGRDVRDAGALWRHLAQSVGAAAPGRPARAAAPAFQAALATIFEQGPLARRLVEAAGPEPSRDRLHAIYGRLSDCLAAGRMFTGLE
jgi:hypothetical protein